MPAARATSASALTDDDYRRLAELRHGQRLFLEWSAGQAQRAGLTPTQHQLLLGIRASSDPAGPTIGDVAAFMVIRHHSAVELVDRAERAGLVTRARDPDRHTVVRLALTAHGQRTLASLSEIHLRELAELVPQMSALWDAVGDVSRTA